MFFNNQWFASIIHQLKYTTNFFDLLNNHLRNWFREGCNKKKKKNVELTTFWWVGVLVKLGVHFQQFTRITPTIPLSSQGVILFLIVWEAHFQRVFSTLEGWLGGLDPNVENSIHFFFFYCTLSLAQNSNSNLPTGYYILTIGHSLYHSLM